VLLSGTEIELDEKTQLKGTIMGAPKPWSEWDVAAEPEPYEESYLPGTFLFPLDIRVATEHLSLSVQILRLLHLSKTLRETMRMLMIRFRESTKSF